MNIKGIPMKSPAPGMQINAQIPIMTPVMPAAFPNNAMIPKIHLKGNCAIHNPKGKSNPNNVITARATTTPLTINKRLSSMPMFVS